MPLVGTRGYLLKSLWPVGRPMANRCITRWSSRADDLHGSGKENYCRKKKEEEDGNDYCGMFLRRRSKLEPDGKWRLSRGGRGRGGETMWPVQSTESTPPADSHREREMDRDRADRGRGRLPCRLGTSGNVFRGGGKKTERMEKTSAPRGKEMNGWMGK